MTNMQVDHLVFDVDAESFQRVVLTASHETPVAVDFWAEWCGPCRSLAPVLEKVVRSFDGALVLAKVDTDKNRELATEQGIRGLPTVRLFKDGKVVDEFSGAYPEPYIREFLASHLPRESDTARNRAETLKTAGQMDEAVEVLRQAITVDPENHRLTIDLASTLVEIKRYDDAASILQRLPVSEQQSPAARRLAILLDFARLASAQGSGAGNDDNGRIDARLQHSAQNVLDNNYEAAIEELLEVLRIDKAHRENAAHKALLSLFELLGSGDPLVARYRPRLAATLY